MSLQRIKTNDTVIVIAGDEAGKTGTVKSVDLKKGRAIVEGLNLVKKTLRRSEQHPEGAIVEKEAPIALSNLTPLHRDNFIRLVKEKKYDGLLFHRVIKDFMVQTGDLTTRLEPTPPPAPAKRNTRTPAKTQKVEPPLQTIPAEICYPALFHKRGAVAAARESDEKNPEHRSSPSQFYII